MTGASTARKVAADPTSFFGSTKPSSRRGSRRRFQSFVICRKRARGVTHEEQILYIAKRAPELARSGGCRSWRDVQVRLRHEGHLLAAIELRGEHTRLTLDRLCDQARSASKAKA